MKRLTNTLLTLLLLLSLTACQLSQSQSSISLEEIPAYDGQAYVELEGNVPTFTQEELESFPVEEYSALDLLGRCGVARATVGLDTMPTEERGEIGQVKPSGWHLAKYDCVDGKYLYNRCHLIGYQLTGENANEENLITGTRYLNVTGMLPFENEVADYVEDTGNHVYYQVTPIFSDSELVARGVQMEALSVEDGGEGVCFNVYVYNVQPGVVIDYATGESWLEGEEPAATQQPDSSGSESQSQGSSSSQQEPSQSGLTYILNNNTMRFHLPDCSSVASMKPENREETGESREALIEQGYQPCGQCKP